ncbi:hypothetical protein [Caballeronia novacaledonica]|uniref:hypothetical protein n=1 Tax=Caballeronia novacaledonica TaxID=1544861 RepID=UPI001EE181C9|nr:hypothetical protein [Caballeronia novacaledonica]
MRVSCLNLASLLFQWAVLLALFVSGAALNSLGLNYSGSDSVGGLKMHPYVMLTLVAALAMLPARSNGPSRLSDRRFRVPAIWSLVAATVLVGKAAIAGAQTLGFLVDTVLASFWVASLVPFMSDRVARRLWRLGFAFVIVESALAVFEVVAKVQFIPIDTWYGSYFRATALHGHPLNNALVLTTVALAVQISATRRVSVLIFFLTTAAISAFGARGALLVYLLLNGFMLLRFGLKSVQRMALVWMGAPLSIALVAWMLASGAFGDRISSVGAYDSSSGVRFQSLAIVQYLDWRQVLLGADPSSSLNS